MLEISTSLETLAVRFRLPLQSFRPTMATDQREHIHEKDKGIICFLEICVNYLALQMTTKAVHIDKPEVFTLEQLRKSFSQEHTSMCFRTMHERHHPHATPFLYMHLLPVVFHRLSLLLSLTTSS